MTARAAAFDRQVLPPRPDLSFEAGLWAAGVSRIAGVDEAGRGALAGPVAAGAVILPNDPVLMETLAGVDDSKQLTPEQREMLAPRIRENALAWAVGMASPEEIDALGILPATYLAVERALAALQKSPDHLLLDFLLLPDTALPQTALIKGDCRSLSIAAASILAKTARDALMRDLDRQYPGYGFVSHKGYGTVRHRAALSRLGPSAIHRLSFHWKG
jgi:ribonuclease HII